MSLSCPPFLPGMGALAPWQTQKCPNATDLYTILTTVAGVPTADLPADSPYVTWALSYAEELTLLVLRAVGQDFYCFAVYCLATSFLLNWCPDTPPSTFFADARDKMNLAGFTPGVVNSAADQGTSDGLLSPEFLSGLTMQNLQALKDPFGRAWLAASQELGNIWGIS
jgi:hypothetical protein